MQDKIFNLGLSVEGISLYLLMDDLDKSGLELDMEPIQARWTGSREQLDQALQELEMQNVIAGQDGTYTIKPVDEWQSVGRD